MDTEITRAGEPNRSNCLPHIAEAMTFGKCEATIGCDVLLMDAEDRELSRRVPALVEILVTGLNVSINLAAGSFLLRPSKHFEHVRVSVRDEHNKELVSWRGPEEMCVNDTITVVSDGILTTVEWPEFID